ncbi:MAG: TIGR03960 family B12-binding radical SAM protein [Anaerolineaceae bacterium]|jgi:radical SAM family uncharacterized protein
MNTSPLIPLIEQILLRVSKPGRYVGGELNQTVKVWQEVQTRIALIFPDIYDLGQPNLGLSILYDILNKRSDVAAERVFAPWTDMEAQLREHRIPLFSLETRHSLKDFDILGITLPYESIYTNVLNILDLSEIPLLSEERDISHPLILAGGQACYNPEPMADFIDAFAIGEGEEVILEIVNTFQAWKKSELSRQDLLEQLALIKGVYVPSLYSVTYKSDGKVRSVLPKKANIQATIHKRIVPVLPEAVTRFIVPNVDIVQDRIAIEIMRGCTRGCRFCHAGIVNRPVRERSVEEIIKAVDKGLTATGYEQVGLLSLSSSDHTRILPLVQQIYQHFHHKRVQFSLPSLRIASFSVDLMDELKELKPSGGFTLAPEAATDRMRAIINKPLDEAQLLETVRTIFEHGWLSLKLYFMIGLPEETEDDVLAIAELSKTILKLGRTLRGNRVRLHVSVGNFIPKPHTPFQWVPMDSVETLQHKIDLLKEALRKTRIKFSYNDPERTLLESWLSRGDRKLGKVILQAWKNGAKMDAWGDHFNIQAWQSAFKTTEINPDFYISRNRAIDETLPWDHISTGVTKRHLELEYKRSQQGITRTDCRESCYYCGILDQFGSIRPPHSEYYWGCPHE